PHVDLDLEAGQQGSRVLIQRTPVDAATARPAPQRLPTREDVLRHREVAAEIHLLVHGADAEALRFLCGSRSYRLSAESYCTCLQCRRAGQHLDECRLPGAVLPHERM